MFQLIDLLYLIIAGVVLYAIYRLLVFVFKKEKQIFDKMEDKK